MIPRVSSIPTTKRNLYNILGLECTWGDVCVQILVDRDLTRTPGNSFTLMATADLDRGSCGRHMADCHSDLVGLVS